MVTVFKLNVSPNPFAAIELVVTTPPASTMNVKLCPETNDRTETLC
jgi:hypothetical protein